MAFKIVNSITLPPARTGLGTNHNKYGVLALEVGECLIFDADDEDFYISNKGRRLHRASSSAFYFQRTTDRKYAVRYLPDGRFGIWRTE